MTLNEFEEFSLSSEDKEIVGKLSVEDIQKIDGWLRLSISYQWQKVAKVVAMAIEISEKTGELLNVPDVFFFGCVLNNSKLVVKFYLRVILSEFDTVKLSMSANFKAKNVGILLVGVNQHGIFSRKKTPN